MESLIDEKKKAHYLLLTKRRAVYCGLCIRFIVLAPTSFGLYLPFRAYR